MRDSTLYGLLGVALSTLGGAVWNAHQGIGATCLLLALVFYLLAMRAEDKEEREYHKRQKEDRNATTYNDR